MSPAQFVKRRKSLGYSQSQLATFFAASIRHISAMETGETPITKVWAVAMAALPEREMNAKRPPPKSDRPHPSRKGLK